MALIDREALMEVVRNHDYPLADRIGSIDRGMFTIGIQQAVDETPEVDAVPVVHGRWDDECQCTACGWYGDDWYKRDAIRFNYCPNCGAKMRGVE